MKLARTIVQCLVVSCSVIWNCIAQIPTTQPTLFQKVRGSQTGGAVFDVASPGHFDSAWVSCPTILHDGKTFRMWYSSHFSSSDREAPGGIGLATSENGIHWKRENEGRPVLSLGQPGAFDAGQVMGAEVLFDGETYRMWYTGDPGRKHASGIVFYEIGLATSKDGIHWHRENGGKPVLLRGEAGSADEVQAATPSILREPDGYRMWYAAWAPQPNHTICAARSKDGIVWEKERNGKPVEGLNPSIAFGHSVIRIGERYLMLYQALKAERGLYAAVSNDGTTWTMLNDSKPVISPATSDEAFDRNVTGHPFMRVEGNKLRVWYTGFQVNRGTLRDWRVRIGLAEAEMGRLVK